MNIPLKFYIRLLLLALCVVLTGCKNDTDSQKEELVFLCTLHNIGATTSEKSLSINEISNWTTIETSNMRLHLEKLIEGGYIQIIRSELTNKYFLTTNGIRKVLTMYS